MAQPWVSCTCWKPAPKGSQNHSADTGTLRPFGVGNLWWMLSHDASGSLTEAVLVSVFF